MQAGGLQDSAGILQLLLMMPPLQLQPTIVTATSLLILLLLQLELSIQQVCSRPQLAHRSPWAHTVG